MTRSLRVSGAALLLIAVAACRHGAKPPEEKAADTSPPPPDVTPAAGEECARAAPEPAFERANDARQSSTVKVARMQGKTIAFVADQDAKALYTVDVDKKVELARTPLEEAPSHLILTKDGRVVVGLRESIVVLEPSLLNAPLATRCSVKTAAEPAAMALTPDERTLLVSSGWGAALAGFDAVTLAKSFEVPLPREPRAVIVSDDGREAIVAHAVGARLSRVALTDPKHPVTPIDLRPRSNSPAGQPATVDPKERRMSCQTFALAKSVEPGGRILAPGVVVDPGEIAFRPSGYGNPNQPTEQAEVAVVPEGTFDPVPASVVAARDFSRRGEAVAECLLPRAATVDPKSKSLLVTCYGSDMVVAYDATSAVPAQAERRRWSVGSGSSGIDVDVAGERAVVWSQFDRAVHLVSLANMDTPVDDKTATQQKIVLAKPPGFDMSHEIQLGRQLFHAAGDPRISGDGRACASCHPDGRDDSITWSTPDGPRRTVMLAGRLEDTAPYSWSGANKDVEEHLKHTFQRLTGTGLSGIELASLIAYVTALQPPPPSVDDPALVARGDAVFHSDGTGCSTCHDGAAHTDKKTHDVASKTQSDKTGTFDTPSLRFVGKRAPYFHDGRYATLRDLLRGADTTMGHTSHLSPGELDGLEAYLRSL